MERGRVRKREQSFHGLLRLLIWQATGSTDISTGSGEDETRWESGREKEGEQGDMSQAANCNSGDNPKWRQTDWGRHAGPLTAQSDTILMYSQKKSEFMPSTYRNFLHYRIKVQEIENPSQPFRLEEMKVTFCILLLKWLVDNDFNDPLLSLIILQAKRPNILSSGLSNVRICCLIWLEICNMIRNLMSLDFTFWRHHQRLIAYSFH